MGLPMAKSKEKGPGLLLISVGNMLASIMISGFLLGYWLDVWLETTPVFMLLFGALGFVGGFLKVFKLLTDPNLQ